MINISQLQCISAERAKRWHQSEDGVYEWSALEWAGAMCGEAGEAANAAKKLRRVEQQINHHDNRLFGQEQTPDEQLKTYQKEVGKEAADTILYALLLCERVGVDAEFMIKEVFNKKSEEYDFPERI